MHFREPHMQQHNAALDGHTALLHDWFDSQSRQTASTAQMPSIDRAKMTNVGESESILINICLSEQERMAKYFLDRDKQTALFQWLAQVANVKVRSEL